MQFCSVHTANIDYLTLLHSLKPRSDTSENLSRSDYTIIDQEWSCDNKQASYWSPPGSLSLDSAQAESNTGHCTPQIWWTEDEQAVHLDYISNGTEEVHQSSIQIDDGSTVDQQQCPFKLQHWSWTRFNFYKIYLEYYLDFSCNFMYVSKLCLNFLYFSYIIVKSYFVLNK